MYVHGNSKESKLHCKLLDTYVCICTILPSKATLAFPSMLYNQFNHAAQKSIIHENIL